MKVTTSPPAPHPKHLKKPLSRLTVNDGVFSWWNGHRPFHEAPAFRSGVASLTIETMSVCALRSSRKPWGKSAISVLELHDGHGAAAFALRRGRDRRHQRVFPEELRQPLTQASGPVAVDNAHDLLIGEQRVVEEFFGAIERLIHRL